MATVRTAECCAHAKTLLGEIQPDARIGANAIKFAPDEMRGVHTPLPDEVLHQPTEVVLRQGGDGCGALTPAFAHGARDIIFAAALPNLEAARIAHAPEAR